MKKAEPLWRESRNEFIQIRGVRYRLRHWGTEGKPRLLLLHGWADVSATFQFIAEDLSEHWHLIAPDWRGCGDSQWLGHAYPLSELVLDLDALIGHCFGAQPARVVGHSMGSNVASLLAAAAPGRIGALASLDAYGAPVDPPARLLDQLARVVGRSRDEPDWAYDSFDDMVDRLMRANPRLGEARARFMARELGEVLADGRVRMRIDPPWRDTLAQLLMAPLYKDAFGRIEAPVLLVGAADSYVARRVSSCGPQELPGRLGAYRRLRHVVLEDAGHNVHHDRPADVAKLLHTFFSAEPAAD